jgi:hypothetical protein
LFCYINKIEYEDGALGPNLPEAIGFCLLAEPGALSSWALYDIDYNGDIDDLNIKEIPYEMEQLLYVAIGYTPSIALVKREINKIGLERQLDQDKFSAVYCDLLQKNFASQYNHKYILVQALVDIPGVINKGGFYWVIEYLPATNTLVWCSLNYEFNMAKTTDFNITKVQLKLLPAKE